jgi:hypothetical protein
MFSERVQKGSRSRHSTQCHRVIPAYKAAISRSAFCRARFRWLLIPARDLTLGSQRRSKEACQYVFGLLKRWRVRSWKEDEEDRASVPHDEVDKLSGLLSEIDAALDAFRKRRLHPRVVEEILGTTAAERRRWTKGGCHSLVRDRFGVAGSRFSSRFIQSPRSPHSPGEPETVKAWRNKDANAPPASEI